MSSNINPLNINGAYPIAGQDNDSQGFRDNFTNIRTNLTFAKTEVEELQNKAVLKAPLGSGTTVSNDLSGATLAYAKTTGFTESMVDHGTLTTGSLALDFTSGDLQKFTMPTQDVTLSFTGWPRDTYATMQVWINFPTDTYTVTFPPVVNIGLESLLGFTGSVLTPPYAGDYIFELGTIDGGLGNVVISQISGLGADAGAITAILVGINDDLVTINGNITTLEGNVTTLEGNVTSLTSDFGNVASVVVALNGNITTLEGNVVTLTSDFSNISANVTTVEGNIVTLTSDFGNLSSNVTTLEGNITTLEGNVGTLTSDFGNISSNVTTLEGNVTSLAANVMVTNATNQLNGNIITGATSMVDALGTVAGTADLDYALGDFHTLTTSAPLTLSLSNWPAAGVYAKMRGFISVANVADTLTFPAEVTVGLANIAHRLSNVSAVAGQTLTPLVGDYLFEFSTVDGGTTVILAPLITP